MTSRPILIVHPSADARRRLTTLLATHEVIEAATRDEALPQLAAQAPRLVLAQVEDFRRLLKDMDRHCPDTIRAVFWSQDDVDHTHDLMELAAQGKSVFTVPSDTLEQTASALEDLLQTRQSRRQVPREPLVVSFRAGQNNYSGAIADVSNQGLGVALATSFDEVDNLTPGTVLEDLLVRQRGRAVFSAGSATVTAVRRAGTRQRKAHLHLGVSLKVETREGASTVKLRGSIPVRGLLRRAGRRGSTFKVRPMDDVQLSEFGACALGTDAETVILSGPLRGIDAKLPGQSVQLSFEFGGVSFTGHTHVVSSAPEGGLVVATPRQLVEHNRRRNLRFVPSQAQSFDVSFVSPLSQTFFHRPILDLQTTGFSFPIDAMSEVLPPGLLVEGIILTLPNGTKARCRGQVVDLGAIAREPNMQGLRMRRCGIRFVEITTEARQAILDAYTFSLMPRARDAQEAGFGDLWTLMREAGQFFPDYAVDGPPPAAIDMAQHRLSLAGGTLGRGFIVRGERGLEGHSAGFRIYSKTWMLQHLAVLPGFRRDENLSHQFSALALAYGEALPDVEFLRYVWRTENRWPNRLSTWVARSMARDHLTRLRFVNYMHQARPELTKVTGLPAVRPATSEDIEAYVDHLRQAGDFVGIRADDLSAAEMSLSTLGERSAQVGLVRRRHVFAVDGADGALALAIAEESTPGLCWPELTNAFRLVTLEPRADNAAQARQALVHHCLDFYRQLGRPSAIVLADDTDVAEMAAFGFTNMGRTAEFTFHKSGMRTWSSLANALFEKLHRGSKANPEEDGIAA